MSPDSPFTWTSGWKSPIYCDNRQILSYPEARSYVTDAFIEVIKSLYLKTEVIAGVATGAIAIGALVAQKLNLPFVYVRPEAKKHGMQNTVEGNLNPGTNVVVIEDLVSTGGSAINAIDSVREAGGKVLGMVSVFNYAFDQTEGKMQEADCEYYSLSDYNELLKVAMQQGIVNDSQLESLNEWRKDPSHWDVKTV